MRTALIAILLTVLFLTACSPSVPPSTFVRQPESEDARIIADATRALPGFEWQNEEEFFSKIVFDGGVMVGAVTYWYSDVSERLFVSNITPYVNTEDQDYTVWDEWNELEVHFFGEAFMFDVWEWELANESMDFSSISTVIDGRGVELAIDADDDTFIMTHLFEVHP